MIYYVEDDNNIRDLVVYTLNQTGLPAMGFAEGAAFLCACGECMPELILLDIMLPGEDGMCILKRLRSDPKTAGLPIIMVTAKGSEYDKVTGLDAGADDYITKPFGMMELVARVRAMLRRTVTVQTDDNLSCGKLSMNTKRHTVSVDGEYVLLTYKEFELLHFLMQNRDIVFTREHLLQTVWDYDYDGGTRTVDVHIQTLRGKLGCCAQLIHTVRGVGYRLGD
ncbi:MAG: response regulator transcription factor [Clostridia bacterium]